MAYSMTGVGTGEVKKEKATFSVELKSVNNRFLEVSCRIPPGFSQFEHEVRDMIRNHIHRGKLYVNISVQSENVNGLDYRVDPKMAKSIHLLLKNLKDTTGIEESIRLEHLLKFSEIFVSPNSTEMSSKIWAWIKKALFEALIDLKHMRAREAKALVKDIVGRVKNLEKQVKGIEKTAEKMIPVKYEKLLGRVQNMMKDINLDPDRLNTEIVLMANKMDVTEECVRLHSHHQLFMATLNNEEVVGKKLNFLLQEMNREANTISSKACNADISHMVVTIKEEIEKLREQVQNLE